MWMEKKKNSTGETAYKFIERYVDPWTGKTKRVSTQLAKNTRQAQNAAQRELNERIQSIMEAYAEEQELKKRIEEEGLIENEKTLEDMIQDWFQWIQDPKSKIQLKGSTISGYSYGIDRLLDDLMIVEKKRMIKDLRSEDMQNFYDRMIFDFKYEFSYVKRFRAILRGAFTQAYKKRYIRNLDAIHYSHIIVPAKTVADLEKSQIPRYLEKTEAEQVFEVLNKYNPLYTQIFELQYHTGMRFGEVVALEEKNLREGFLLDIHGTYDNATRSRTRRTKVPPKTNKSFRTIELGDAAVEILKERMYYNKFLKKKKNKFIFVTKSGRPYDLGTINNFLIDHQKEFKTATKLSTHVFRHTHISMLAERNVPLKVIMDRVGHEDRETTEKIYMHVTRKQKTDLIKTLNEL